MVQRREVESYFDAMGNSSKLAIAAVKKLMRALDGVPPAMLRNAMVDAVPRLVAAFGDVASAAALQWYAQQRVAASPVKDWTPDQLADVLDPDEIRAAVRAAAGTLWDDEPDSTERFVAALSGRIDGWVKGQARRTVLKNVSRDPAKPRYARVPRGAKTCAFCEMVASRGFVYVSEDSAIGRHHDKFHAHCDCQIVPAWDKSDPRLEGYDPDAMYERYLAARGAVEDEGGNPADHRLILAKMRRMFPDQYKDGIDESKPKRKPGPKAGRHRADNSAKRVPKHAIGDGDSRVEELSQSVSRARENVAQLTHSDVYRKETPDEVLLAKKRKYGYGLSWEFSGEFPDIFPDGVEIRTLEDLDEIIKATESAGRGTRESKLRSRARGERKRLLAEIEDANDLPPLRVVPQLARDGSLAPGAEEALNSVLETGRIVSDLVDARLGDFGSYREAVLSVLSEIREMGGGVHTKYVGPADIVERLHEAHKVYPSDWNDATGREFKSMLARRAERGGNAEGYCIDLSPMDRELDHTAVHELGHSMQHVVPGLKDMDALFWAHRVDRVRTHSGRVLIADEQLLFPDWPGYEDEVAVPDKWARNYTGKTYERDVLNRESGQMEARKQPLEIFTTGVESLLADSQYFERPEGFDDEFRDYILGVLATL